MNEETQKKIQNLKLAVKKAITPEAKAMSLNELAREWDYQGENNTAEKIANESLAIAQRHELSVLASEALTILGNIENRRCNYDISLQHYYKAIAWLEKKNAGFTMAKIQNNIAVVSLKMGAYSDAIEGYIKAVNIFESLDNVEHYIAEIYIGMGNVYNYLNDCEKALEYYEKSLIIYQYTDNKRAIGLLYGNMGAAYHRLGQYDKAMEHYRKACDFNSSVGYKIGWANDLSNMSILYSVLGDYYNALQCSLESLEIKKEIEDKIGTARTFAHISTIYSKLSDNDLAIKYINEAIKISSEINDYIGLSQDYMGLADRYFSINEYEISIEYLKKSLELAEKHNLELGKGQSFMRLGSANATLCRYEDALNYYAQALEICDKINAFPLKIHITGNIGILFSDPRYSGWNIETSKTYFIEAIRMIGESKDNVLLIDYHLALANLYEQSGDLEKALLHYKEYHRIEKEVFNEESDKRLKNLLITHEVERMKKEAELLHLENDKMKTERDLQAKHLTSLTLNLVQQNEFLGTLRLELLRLAEKASGHIELSLKDVGRRLKRQTQAQDEWAAFEEQFRLLHTDFIERLSRRYPILSPTELRICTLMKIGLTSKDIASLLCVTVRCIETHRYRIRKKMGLQPDENLTNLLAII